jgi:hypothetical protein
MAMTTETQAAKKYGFLLKAARLGWLALFAILLTIHILGIGPRYQELTAVCPGDPCISQMLTAEDVAALEALGISHTAYGVYQIILEVSLTLTVALLGLLIFRRLGDSWFGLLVALVLILIGLNFLSEADSAYLRFHPELLPLTDFVTRLASVAIVLLLLLFPDGRFVPRWSRWLVLLLTAFAALDRFLFGDSLRVTSDQYSLPLLIAILASFFVGIAAQVYRYRYVSTPIERQQTKWVLLGFIGLLIAVFIYSLFVEISPPRPGNPRLFFNLIIFTGLFLLLLIFPVMLVLSIVRYRLWDIDLVIRKTLLYAILSGLLVAIYFGSVVILQSILVAVTGASSPAVIVLSTLLIAALFNPLRRGIQSFIDRRFFRGQYDRQQVLTQFAAAAREETDLEAMTAELTQVVQETMQPEQVSLWLRTRADLRVVEEGYE